MMVGKYCVFPITIDRYIPALRQLDSSNVADTVGDVGDYTGLKVPNSFWRVSSINMQSI